MDWILKKRKTFVYRWRQTESSVVKRHLIDDVSQNDVSTNASVRFLPRKTRRIRSVDTRQKEKQILDTILVSGLSNLFSSLLSLRNSELEGLPLPSLSSLVYYMRLDSEYYSGKYHCTIDLLFDWLGISCMTTYNFCFYWQNRLIQTSQTGGQWYSDTFPFSIPWVRQGGAFPTEEQQKGAPHG
jgi:hypothetical protein